MISPGRVWYVLSILHYFTHFSFLRSQHPSILVSILVLNLFLYYLFLILLPSSRCMLPINPSNFPITLTELKMPPQSPMSYPIPSLTSFHHVSYWHLCLIRTTAPAVLRPITISLGGIITLINNQILRSIIMLATQITLQDRLGAIGISLLRIERCARHVRDHGVSAAEGVLGVAEDVVFWCGLREPDVSSVAAEVA